MASPTREARKQRSNNAKAIRLAQARRARRNKAFAIILVIAIIFGGGAGLLAFSGNKRSSTAAGATSTTEQTATPVTAAPVAPGRTITGTTPCPKTDGTEERASSFAAAPPNCLDANKTYTATFNTTEGKVVVALDAKTMPNAVNNFVVLSRYKYYDGSAIVRTNTGIDIIQGGAPSTQTNADPGPGYTIKDEGGPFTYADGDFVMARTSQADSTGGQWFFVAGANGSQLNGQGPYLNIGKTTEGLDVLHNILALHQATSSSEPSEGAPKKLVTINSITISES